MPLNCSLTSPKLKYTEAELEILVSEVEKQQETSFGTLSAGVNTK